MLDLIGELVDARPRVRGRRSRASTSPSRASTGYGALSHRTLDELRESAGARVDVDEAKRSPIDFALWKAAKPGEPDVGLAVGPRAGPGGTSSARRCRSTSSARASTSTAAATTSCSRTTRTSGRRPRPPATTFARHWIHSGMVDDRRREDVEVARQLHHPRRGARRLRRRAPFRLAVLQTHYRAPLELGPAELDAAAKAIERLDALVRARRRRGDRRATRPPMPRRVDRFRAAMDDDFDTAARDGGDLRRGRGTRTVASTTATDARAATLVATVRELSAVARPRARGRRDPCRRRRRRDRRAGARARRGRAPRATSRGPTGSATSSRPAASSSRTRPAAPSGTDERPRRPPRRSAASGRAQAGAA